MENNNVIKVFNINESMTLPDNLGNFRDVTISDREMRELKIKLLSLIINYHLGWYETDAKYQQALSSMNTSTQREIEKVNSLGPIKTTSTFRLSPGEAKRLTTRIQYLPLLWTGISQGYWSRASKQSNLELITMDKRSPSVIINKYKK